MKKQELVEGKTVEREPKSLRERGQSIVILAAGILVLLGFTGLAVDLGALWVRDSQLISAVDAAVLAGAPEARTGSGVNATAAADSKAISFLHTNDIPLDTIQNFTSAVGQTELGAVEYTITATWQVDTYFMVLFGFDQIALTRSATAAYFPLVDIYASSRVESGVLSTSNQAVFGPNSCTRLGDPFTPINSPWEPGVYSYRYRILIPASYDKDIVRVELFDTDSFNQSNNDVQITHSNRWYT
ncbi:MAG: Tad domain-containing protein, partial [Anaerolineales bacterium]|nr:Tad domain-containing protein [Anaerolineales bacterium]